MKQEWEYRTLGDAVNKGSSNISLNKIKDEEGDYPVYGAKGFATNISFFQQEQPYLAIIKDGAGIGRVSKHPKQSSVLATMQYLIPKDGFDIDFVKYFLNSIDFEKHRNGSTIPHIYFKDYRFEPFPILPFHEQKCIVAILDEAFAGISLAVANAEKNLANARELFESYLNNVFTQKGDGWKKTQLSEFTKSVSTGPFGSLLHKSDYVTEGVPLVNPINIVNGKIVPDLSKLIDNSTKERLSSYILNVGDIVVGRRGEIGRCAVVASEQDGWICGTGCFVIRPLADVNPEFLTHLLRSQTYRENLESVATGATMKNISNKALSNLIICIPSFKVQVSILNQISFLEHEVSLLETIYQQKLTALNELKKSILQKAFTGQLTNATDKG